MHTKYSRPDLQVWGDVRCPWCWIGLRRLQDATARGGSAETVVHRSFLLEPAGQVGERSTIASAAVASWGMTQEQWAGRSAAIRDAGAAEGLEINIDSAQTVDSRDAHRLLKIAVGQGVPAFRAWDLVFDAHLRCNANLEDGDVLLGIAAELGLARQPVRDALTAGAFADEVEADHQAAVALGVRSVPTIVRRQQVLSGVVSTDDLVRLLTAEDL